MKVCSFCLRCYDDSNAVCPENEGHGSLTHQRAGNCLLVKGYRLDSRFGSGSLAELYQATHRASKQSVLIKFVNADDSFSDPERELEAVARLKHPNLARVLECGKVDGNEFYVVFEDVTGQNLFDYMAMSSPVSEGRAIEIIRQIAEGLEELHNAGVVHRAVNPANIYITESEDENCLVKVHNFDFGGMMQKSVALHANSVESVTKDLQYFSPEQFLDQDVDFRSDIYSLATIFYRLLLGRVPVPAPNPDSIRNYVFNESDIKDLSLDLRALLGHTLRQSFQHKLELRPRTSNLVRQIRHLEQIANRAKIGLKDLAVDYWNNEQPHSTLQTSTSKLPEMDLSEVAIDPEIRETAQKTLVPEAVSASVSRSNDEDRDLVESGSYQPEKYEAQVSSKDVRLSIDDFYDYSELDAMIDDSNDWKESGDDEAGIESGPESKRKSAIPFNSSLKGRRSRGYLYVAGLLISALLGGAVTANILYRQGFETRVDITPDDRVRPNERQEFTPVEILEIPNVSGSELDSQQELELADAAETEEIVTAATAAINLRRVTVVKDSTSRPAKKRRPKRPNKPSGRTTAKRKGAPVERPNEKTRAGLFEDVIIYY